MNFRIKIKSINYAIYTNISKKKDHKKKPA